MFLMSVENYFVCRKITTFNKHIQGKFIFDFRIMLFPQFRLRYYLFFRKVISLNKNILIS